MISNSSRMFRLINLYLLIFVHLLFVITSKTDETYDNCTLPNGKTGKCVPIDNCKQLNKDEDLVLYPCETETKSKHICCPNNSRHVGEISKQTCNDVYQNGIQRPEASAVIPSHGDGGGGYNAKPKEYPHMALLGFGEEDDIAWACGGSLISENYVLSAAHCMFSAMGRAKFVRLGDLDITREDDDADPHNFNVINITVHPEYNPRSRFNDIALLKIHIDSNLTKIMQAPWGLYIAPACLHTERNISDPKLTALGWGETSYQGPGAEHLQVMELREADYKICNETFSNALGRKLFNGIDDNGQICAGNYLIDTCRGDSGGPLQIKNANYKTGYTIVGITSFGKPCLLTNKPAVYTRVSNYIEWIESIVWPELSD